MSDTQKIKPLNGHILVEVTKEDDGVISTRDLEDRQFEGTIIEISEDCEIDVKQGDKVIFEKFADSSTGSFKYNDEQQVTLIKETMVMGVWG